MLMMSGDTMNMVVPVDAQRWAVELWKRSVGEGQLRRIWRRLLGRCTYLRTLDEIGRRGQHTLGRQAVEIARIVGSEGRANDFDSTFAPLSLHTRDRWSSVARARREGRALPPVLLIKTADGYYVRDGHHRISVARALGEDFIEAEVVSWEG